jgi:hypothetical protein
VLHRHQRDGHEHDHGEPAGERVVTQAPGQKTPPDDDSTTGGHARSSFDADSTGKEAGRSEARRQALLASDELLVAESDLVPESVFGVESLFASDFESDEESLFDSEALTAELLDRLSVL